VAAIGRAGIEGQLQSSRDMLTLVRWGKVKRRKYIRHNMHFMRT
jgi:hypothetical protein